MDWDNENGGNAVVQAQVLARLLNPAAVYAVGRRTSVPHTVVRNLEVCWHCIGERGRRMLHRLVESAPDLGDPADAGAWGRLLALPAAADPDAVSFAVRVSEADLYVIALSAIRAYADRLVRPDHGIDAAEVAMALAAVEPDLTASARASIEREKATLVDAGLNSVLAGEYSADPAGMVP